MKAAPKIIALLVGTVLLVTLGVMAAFLSFQEIREAGDARQKARLLIAKANDLLSALKDAETGQRGYLLTGDGAFLAPYLLVRDDLRGQLEELRQFPTSGDARQSLDNMVPLLESKLAEMSYVVELRRSRDLDAAIKAVAEGRGKHSMDLIRFEMSRFIQSEEGVATKREAEFQSTMFRMSVIIVVGSVFVLLFALLSVYWIYRETQQRLKNSIHLETQRLLEVQEGMNQQLHETNANLQASEEKLAVTLKSIGDAVITTDAVGHVTLLNPLAEKLTGWTQSEAAGQNVDEIFHIINRETRQNAINPLKETLANGTILGLENHTVLIARDGSECDIADSCAPIRDSDGHVTGAVLVFRDVTRQYAAQQNLRENVTLIQTILNAVVDGIITLHALDGIIKTVNPAAEKMFGYTSAELIGQHFSMLVPEFDRSLLTGSIEKYGVSGGARSLDLARDVVGQRKDGSIFPMELAGSEM